MSVNLHIKSLLLIACLLGQAIPGQGQLQAPPSNAVRFLDEDIELIRAQELKKPLSPFEASLPAELDPFGNWGEVVEGIQVSLRFEQDEYTVSEPLIGYVKIRNVGSQPSTYWYTAPAFFALEVVAINARNETLAREDLPRGTSLRERAKGTLADRRRCEVRPGRQRTEVINLHEIFNLTTNGEYVVYCRQRVSPLNGKGDGWSDSAWVQSGNAIIRIKGAKPGITATNAAITNRLIVQTNIPVTAKQTNADTLVGPSSSIGGKTQTGAKAATGNGDGDGGNGSEDTMRNLKYGSLAVIIVLFTGILLWRNRKHRETK